MKTCICLLLYKKIFHKRLIIVCYGTFELKFIEIRVFRVPNLDKVMSLFQWVGRSRTVEQMSLFFMSLFRGGG